MKEIEPILAELKEIESTYQASDEILRQLGEKTLLLFVAPSAVGKSTLMNSLETTNEDFARISGFTTRNPRPDDEPGMYRYISHDADGLNYLLDLASKRELVQFGIHPTTGIIYGTEIEDYPGQFNCKDVLGHTVNSFRNLGALETHTFSLVCDTDQWLERLKGRTDITDHELQARLKEAAINTSWSLQDEETIFIRNNNGELFDAMDRIIDITTQQGEITKSEQQALRSLAELMYRAALTY